MVNIIAHHDTEIMYFIVTAVVVNMFSIKHLQLLASEAMLQLYLMNC